MKVAVLGPVAKDFITIDGKSLTYIGGPVYYISVALKNLGIKEVIPFVSAAKEDQGWIEENFPGMNVVHIPAEGTLRSYVEYSSGNPDIRKHEMEDFQNVIRPTKKILEKLEHFDWIIFGPLLHDQAPHDLFLKLKHKKLVLGNFGMFSYNENGKFVWKNPENMLKVLPFIDYLFLDVNEALFASGEASISAAARRFSAAGLKHSVFTEASKGSHVFVNEKHHKIPAFPPQKILDPTGAGDTYEAAFMRATELFSDPVEQGRFAAMAATMKLEKQGAFSGNTSEVLKKLDSI